MKRISLVLVAILAMSVSAVLAQTPEEAVAKFQEGNTKVQNKQFAEAVADYESALEIAKQCEGQDELMAAIKKQIVTTYKFQGGTAIKSQNFDVAISSFQKMKEAATSYSLASDAKQSSRMISMAYQAKGSVAFNAKDFKSALDSFEKGYAEDPSNIKLANLTAQSYAELGNLDKAVEIYTATIEKVGTNEKYAAEVAAAKAGMEQYILLEASKNIKDNNLEGAIALADGAGAKSASAQMAAVQVANTLKKYDVVIARADNAAALQTDDAKKSDVYFMLGVAYQNKGNNAKAIEALKKVTAGNNVTNAKSYISQLSK